MTPTAVVEMTPLQKAYSVGRMPELPLGGIECLAYFEFRGRRLEMDRLQNAVDQVHRHPSMRCVFVLERDGWLRDGDLPAPTVTRHDVRDDPRAGRDAIRRRMMRDVIDIGRGRNWGIELSTGSADDHVLHLVFSLAALDVAAVGVIMNELAEVYVEQDHAPDRHAPDRDTRPQLMAEVRDRVLAATRARRSVNRRGDSPPLLPGPDLVGLTEPITDDVRMTTLRRELSAPTWAALQDRAKQLGVSTAALVLASYGRALRAWSERGDFCVTVAGLDVRGTESVIADRTVAYAHRSFAAADFEAEVHGAAADLRRLMVERRDVLTEVREAQAAGESVEPSRCVFTYGVEMPLYSALVRKVFGQPQSWGQTPQSAIDCRLMRLDEDTIEVGFDVRRAAIPERIASMIFELFCQNLVEIAETGQPRTVLPRAQQEIRDRLNASPAKAERLLYDGFRAQVGCRPTAIAIDESARLPGAGDAASDATGGGEALSDAYRVSYGELDRRALAFAGRIAARAEPGSVVAVQLPRGIDQVVAILGTLYAGCVYLPLSLEAPAARVERIRERSQWSVRVMPEFLAEVDHAPALPRPIPRSADDLAYIIFTSGSTGEPKGVAIAHAAAANTIADINERHGVGPEDVVVGVSGIDFDLSVYDLFGTLSAGARLVTLRDSETRDPFRWGEVVRHSGATIWNSVPMLLEMLVAANESLPTLRTLLVAGDWIPLDLPARSRALAHGSTFVAMGGATEASIWSNEYVINAESDLSPDWTSIPYGRPLTGQRYRVVDPWGFDRPDECVGELLIGGAGVAWGYYRDHDRTQAAFFHEPDGERWYRTGDLGYWRDGLLFFAGRRDTQVKIRGHRVECGEAESRLLDHPAIASAIVVPIRERSALGACYVLTAGQPEPSAAELEALMAAELSWYLVPAAFRSVPDLPVTANGKVDRDAVARLLSEDTDDGHTGTDFGDDVFTMVAEAWARSLGRPVAADANYFALGGDSLTATTMCAELRDRGLNADLAHLFRAPVLGQFANSCRFDHQHGMAQAGEANEPLPEAGERRPDWQELAAAEGASLSSLGLREWCRWLWRYELRLPDSLPGVADDADFFALGGDSLTAARLCATLRRTGVETTVATLFRNPRFDDFWRHCSLAEDDSDAADSDVDIDGEEKDGEDDAFDLTPLQLAYALGSDGIPGVVRTTPCVAVILRSDDPTTVPRWSTALETVVSRYDVLRLVRSDDWRQRVVPHAVPELAEIPFDLSDAQFRDVLRRTSVNAFDAPAVRGFVRRNQPHELGLVFNYLALDSLSVAAILRDVAAAVTGDGHGLPASPDIGPFRRYATAKADELADELAESAETTEPPPAPMIGYGAIPEHDAVFDSYGRVLSADIVGELGGIARDLGVTLNSVLLHAYGSAIAAATGQRRLAVNVPTASRPVQAPDALGQFTDLVLCECGDDVSVREIHQNLGTAMALAGTVTYRRTPERQRYPVVFTSLLGSPLAEDLAGGLVRTTWTHTRTPAVLIDCQITPTERQGIELRWDYPREVVAADFIEKAFADFTARLVEPAAAEVRAGLG